MAEGAPRRPRSKRRIECQEYLAPTLRVQQELRDDVDVLQEQEGWDVTTRRGVADWIRDTPSIWRALRVRCGHDLTDNSETAMMRTRRYHFCSTHSISVSPCHYMIQYRPRVSLNHHYSFVYRRIVSWIGPNDQLRC